MSMEARRLRRGGLAPGAAVAASERCSTCSSEDTHSVQPDDRSDDGMTQLPGIAVHAKRD